MKLGFKNGYKKLYYALKTNPWFLLFLIGYLVLFSAVLITSDSVWIWPILFVLLLYLALQKASRHDLTLFFYASRFCGRSYIYQRRNIRRGPCREMRTVLAWETKNLIDILPAGRYIAVTHETAIKLLLKDAGVTMLRCVPAYKGSLSSLQRTMLGCGKCHKKRFCGLRSMSKEPRQFYYVEFNKEREARSNPIR
ncbi:MAG: hypothetical protein VB064_02395 [Oscillospiraceae bacterium]|nr:hypothetical protein [Oscillospiraceae bacterium]